jgi:hypothetical protein
MLIQCCALTLGYQILIASGIITQHLRNIFFKNDIGEYDTPLQIVARAMEMLVFLALPTIDLVL